MNKLLFFIYLLYFFVPSKNCQSTNKVEILESKVSNKIVEEQNENCKTALKFINLYLKQIFPFKESSKTTEDWVKQNTLVTESFKKEYITTVKKALEVDPELGLEYDYILDAQDYPEEGLVIEHCDNKKGIVKLKVKNWNRYFLIIKLIKENGKTKVDACGTIKVPENERYKKE